MNRLALALAVCVLVLGLATADTLTHRKTGEKIQGRCLFTVKVDGREEYVFDQDGNVGRYPTDIWALEKTTPPPPPSSPPSSPPPTVAPTPPPQGVWYAYRRVWIGEDEFHRMYARNRDWIVSADGTCFILENPGGRMIREVVDGRLKPLADSARVSRVLGPQEAVLSLGEEMIHVKGLDTAKLGDGSPVDGLRIVCVGNREYEGRRIRRFEVCRPPTLEEFKEALLHKGFRPPREPVICDGCEGRKTVNCSDCRGTGTVDERRACGRCNGTGGGLCARCRGQRFVRCGICTGCGLSAPGGPVWCSCRATGLERCSCGGEPYPSCRCPYCRGGNKVPCRGCRGGGLTCSECSGKGRLRCGKCRGIGKLTCSACKGEGFVSIPAQCRTCQGGRTVLCARCAGRGSLPPPDLTPSEPPGLPSAP